MGLCTVLYVQYVVPTLSGEPKYIATTTDKEHLVRQRDSVGGTDDTPVPDVMHAPGKGV